MDVSTCLPSVTFLGLEPGFLMLVTPPSSRLAASGLPESSSNACTGGTAARASATEALPRTWITGTSATRGLEGES